MPVVICKENLLCQGYTGGGEKCFKKCVNHI